MLALIGDKWSILVVGQLCDRTLRFGELHRAVTGVSQRMLTLTLRQLERDGLVTRTVHACVPPRVELRVDGTRDATAGLRRRPRGMGRHPSEGDRRLPTALRRGHPPRKRP
ncbi:winged helix-turn-helix transcriptional regulator [Streptomyces monomycini]|uniref:winged helix-turn-helix transcriptional regulator n=1 Tax=Streptomyces monomycini TaxID=371720 RepID=UPI0027E2E926|nr:helix-turn-helix domain-containing protein [Streptomyces monomycini]